MFFSLVIWLCGRYLGYCDGSPRDLVEVYRDLGLHYMFASSLVLEHTQGDERFSSDVLYRAGKNYPHPMMYVVAWLLAYRSYGLVVVFVVGSSWQSR